MGFEMYSQDERSRRWALGRALMDAEGVEALLLYENTYFTCGPSGAIVIFPRDGRPVALTDGPSSSPWVPTRPSRHAYGIAEVLREHRLHRSAVGVLGLEPYPPIHRGPLLPHSLWSQVLGLLPHVAFTSVWPGYFRLVVRHSGEELAILSEGARIAKAMADAVADALRPGTHESELSAAGLSTGYALGATPTVRVSAGGGPISPGDVVPVEIRCTYGFLEVRGRIPLMLGEPTDPVADALDRAMAGYAAGLRAIRPGNTVGQAAAAVAAQLGGPGDEPRLVGLNPLSLSAGGQEPPTGHDFVLAPGMTLALQAGHRRVTVGGTVLTTEDDAIELFTPFTGVSSGSTCS
ncbi:M24 family metallopeptidase [Nonomuraea sp. LPB2021202275-12-8]|uniref:M24 family metallopeptidase n=1 Tax=Nonomuraea sp. LPB2021202275-12-8 TaxID=3120159 RepID=UPI00300CF680